MDWNVIIEIQEKLVMILIDLNDLERDERN